MILAAHAAGTYPISLTVDGTVRHALVHLPPAERRAAALPVVCMFHGAGSTARMTIDVTGWTARADAHGFVAVFPEGTPRHADRPPAFLQNPQTWNDGSGRGHVTRSAVDDVGFFAALLERLAVELPIDRSRVYVSGFSNGAALAFRLGAELAERIAAIAPVAGHCWLEHPRPARPVPLLFVFGTADPINPLDGGEVLTPWGHAEYHPPALRSPQRWAAAIGCAATPELVRDEDGVRMLRWAPCAGTASDGAEVRYCTIDGMGHVWPGGPRMLPERIGGRATQLVHGADLIWDFFRQYSL